MKFTDQGRVVLRVGKAAGPAGEDELRLLVEDTGCGIPPGHLERVFEPFEQTEEGRRRQGTGLGLAICRELAAAMGGELQAESRLGEGSRFWLQIPLRGEPASPSARLHAASGTLLYASSDRLTREVVSGLAWRVGARCTRIPRLDAFEATLGEVRGAGRRARVALVDGFFEGAESLARAARRQRLSPWLLWTDPRAGAPGREGIWDGVVRTPLLRGHLERLLAGEGERDPDSGPVAEARLAGVRVLVVDDDAVSRKLISRLLEQVDAEVVVAGDAAEARRLFADGAFGLVLADWNLPDSEPGALASELREIDRRAGRRRTPMVLCSADEVEREAWAAAGLDDALSKPITAQRLYETAAAWAAETIGVG
ncbi:MAG: ATP-binding protein [Acidobacteriota bacterium]|nr:ATP-binding protein [Acidobacteriota bacterium]